MILTGLIQALGLVLVSVAFNIIIRFATLIYEIEAIVFACVSIVSAALVLSVFAGPGRLVTDTLKTPATWIYGVATIGIFVIDIYLTQYVSATEMSLFGRMAIPVSLLASYLFFKRSQPISDIIGLVFVIIGLVVLFSLQPTDILYTIFGLALFAGIVQAAEVIFAETHKQSAKAHESGNIRDKARVVGFVSFITSMMFLAMAMLGSLLNQFVFVNSEVLSFMPHIDRFAHAPSIWFGIFFGTFLSSTYRYCLWSSSYKLKSDNILALLAFVPLLTLLAEWLLSMTPYLERNMEMFSGERGLWILGCCFVMTMGSGISVFLRVRAEFAKERSGDFATDFKKALAIDAHSIASIQHAANALDDYEIIRATLEYTGDDWAKSAKLLDISLDTLRVIYDGKGSLALVMEASHTLARNYRKNVASRDALTGLLSRGAFMQELKTSVEKSKVGTLLYIDLDKFKPVNDTYGHDAGDAVLAGVALKLQKILPKKALVARLGGDEFSAFLPGKSLEQSTAYADEIEKQLLEPFMFKEHTITIGACVGLAMYPTDAQAPEALLKIADGGMYAQKQEKAENR